MVRAVLVPVERATLVRRLVLNDVAPELQGLCSSEPCRNLENPFVLSQTPVRARYRKHARDLKVVLASLVTQAPRVSPKMPFVGLASLQPPGIRLDVGDERSYFSRLDEAAGIHEAVPFVGE